MWEMNREKERERVREEEEEIRKVKNFKNLQNF